MTDDVQVSVDVHVSKHLEHHHADASTHEMEEWSMQTSDAEEVVMAPHDELGGDQGVGWTRSIYECTDCGHRVTLRLWVRSDTRID